MRSTVVLVFLVEGQPVELALAGASAAALDGTLRLPAGTPVLSSLVEALGIDPGPVAEALDALRLTDARVVYGEHEGARTMAIACNGGDASLLRWTRDRASLSVLSLRTGIGLGSLPLIGSYLSAAGDLSVAGVAAGAGSLSAGDVALVREANPPGLPRLPEDGFLSSATLFVDVRMGDATATVLLPLGGGSPAPRAAGAAPPVPEAPKRAGAWLNVQKQLGPLIVRRVGFNFRDKRLWLLVDAACTMAGLTLDLQGAGLGFTVQLPPSVSVARPTGIAVSYTGPLDISGGLAAIDHDGVVDYVGQLMVRVANFQITAIGAYTTVKDAASGREETSLFAFAVLAAPLGGPPAFFVTAVALGFGFNRRLTVPTAATAADFPLMRAVNATPAKPSPFKPNASITDALGVLGRWIQPSIGEGWVAVGVKFTSFRLIDTAALVTARFGRDMEFDLIGVSTLTIPYGSSSPIAYAQLGLVASIRPSAGVIAVFGQLTPGSYVLSPDCRLSGGFAFCAWFGGPHAGDFVYTLGGYHPRFARPSHYPEVPRLAAQWNISGNLTVKGSLYFAVTPSTVMAGGAIEAQWQSGDLRAWFNTQVDFLLCWRPFHYEADVSVSLGASYRVDLWLTSFTVTVHVGVSVRFWGPPIAGLATVDLGVVTISIGFGPGRVPVGPISWDEFKRFILPRPDGDTYCLARVSAGLTRDLRAEDAESPVHWIVDPERLELVTFSAIPIKHATLALGTGAPRPAASTPSWTSEFGVGPVGVDNARFSSVHDIAVNRLGTDLAPERIRLKAIPVLDSVPAAAWVKAVAMNPGLATANDQTARLVRNALTGFTLAVDPLPPAAILTVPTGPLQMSGGDDALEMSWSAAAPPAAEPFDPEADPAPRWAALTHLYDDEVSALRRRVLTALAEQHVAIDPRDVTVRRLSADAEHVLLAPPVIDALGAERKAA